MAHHSSILAWEIPWMGEPGRLQSVGSQRVAWLKNFNNNNNKRVTTCNILNAPKF